jgi:hypothetical protein
MAHAKRAGEQDGVLHDWLMPATGDRPGDRLGDRLMTAVT